MATLLTNVNRNPLKSSVKHEVCDTLLALLHSSLDLKNQLKLAHWNLRDSNFIGLHRLFDEVAALVEKGNDAIAERVRQLGEVVDANTKTVSTKTSLKPFPTGLVTANAACEAITHSMATVVDELHEAIDSTDEAGDPVTSDMLTQISGQLEVQLWFIESHI